MHTIVTLGPSGLATCGAFGAAGLMGAGALPPAAAAAGAGPPAAAALHFPWRNWIIACRMRTDVGRILAKAVRGLRLSERALDSPRYLPRSLSPKPATCPGRWLKLCLKLKF